VEGASVGAFDASGELETVFGCVGDEYGLEEWEWEWEEEESWEWEE
jgi:hypothetical protein